MKIAICGSMVHASAMVAAQEALEAQGYEIERPNVNEGEIVDGVRVVISDTDKRQYIDEHFAKIDASDAVLVINEAKNGVDGYIGGNTLLEIGRAYAQGLEIFLLHPVPEVSYSDEIRSMQPVILDGDLANIDEYMNSLPILAVSSESPVKHLALSRGLRRAGIRTRVVGVKVESGVNEQPISIEESYEGAVNRHANLKALPDASSATYLATIESGYHTAHKDHNAFGCSALVLEKVNGEQKIGVDLDIEFPRSMTDKIPHEYPDIGVLVQQEYGSKLKDPYPFFTGGKLTRARVLENAVYNLAIQL
jgi:non-canonical (house-cleaning) NTP pyrophosphatase